MRHALLLDTCAVIYLLGGKRIAKAAYAALDRAINARVPSFVSLISVWEVGNLARKGRFDYPHPPQVWLEKLRETPGIEFCELGADVLLESSFLPGNLHSNDPADRIIAATAREYGFTVMTRDRALLEYGREGYLSVLEC